MICDTLEMMTRVARIGASKMTNQGYTHEPDADVPDTFLVTTPDGMTTYTVKPGISFCNCAFHRNNHTKFLHKTTCKHLEHVRIEEARTAQTVAQLEEVDADRADFMNFAASNERSVLSRSLAEVIALVAAELPDEDEKPDFENADEWDNVPNW